MQRTGGKPLRLFLFFFSSSPPPPFSLLCKTASFCLSICLSFFLSVCLSFCLSFFPSFFYFLSFFLFSHHPKLHLGQFLPTEEVICVLRRSSSHVSGNLKSFFAENACFLDSLSWYSRVLDKDSALFLIKKIKTGVTKRMHSQSES